MAINPTYPGVYVQEVSSGVRSIAGVPTSTTLFIGRTAQGPINRPTRLLGASHFARLFGDNNTVGDMARYISMFYQNGGTDAYVMRIAHNADAASVTLQNEAVVSLNVLTLTAAQEGSFSNLIRVRVIYDTRYPEAEFNMEVWPEGNPGELEVHRNLTMNPNSALYAQDVLNQQSKLVNAQDLNAAPAVAGYSQAGRPVPGDGTIGSVFTNYQTLFNLGGQFRISVAGSPFLPVDISPAVIGPQPPDIPTFANNIAQLINAEFTANNLAAIQVVVSFEQGPVSPVADGGQSTYLRISGDVGEDVFIQTAPTANDLGVRLMLGTAQDGLEVGAHAALRPAANALSVAVTRGATFRTISGATQNTIASVQLPDSDGAVVNITQYNPAETISQRILSSVAGNPLYRTTVDPFPDDGPTGFMRSMRVLRDAINNHRELNLGTFPWRAELWGNRLAVVAAVGPDSQDGGFTTGGGFNIGGGNRVTRNVRNSALGPSGTTGLQVPGASGADGTAPEADDYVDAYGVIDREVDLFNLMVLPPSADSAVAADMSDVYRPASIFCQQRRAFLLMDPPVTWQTAAGASTGVSALKIGLVKDYSAIFYPRLAISEDGRRVNVGPAGAMAGLMARIDAQRGVWKAAAGTEADLRAVVGVEYPFSDLENGFMNPRGVNTLRQFPTGVVSWGARTMDGDDSSGSEWKYIPIRRLALFIEESLYRGLQWVVFEPNDEPLWAQIRLNVGAFMHGLFRQQAFQGATKSAAYFVKCDSETTTQADINLGIVNIWVGFAPLKPAEFVILSLQQIAGQIEA